MLAQVVEDQGHSASDFAMPCVLKRIPGALGAIDAYTVHQPPNTIRATLRDQNFVDRYLVLFKIPKPVKPVMARAHRRSDK